MKEKHEQELSKKDVEIQKRDDLFEQLREVIEKLKLKTSRKNDEFELRLFVS